MEMKIQVFYVVVALHIIICAGSNLVVTPSSHQFVAINSTENVTFICDATGGDTTLVRDAVWEVQDRQIQNDQDNALRIAFSEIGIFLCVLQAGVSEIIITSDARMWYLNEDPPIYNITVVCSSFTDERSPLLEVGDVLNVTSFDVPLIPTALNLDPNPDDLTELIFSWVIPADAMAGVELTYTPAITGLSFNISNTTIDNVIMFTDNASLDCQPHVFSVFASNTAGRGPTDSIIETIPISPDLTALSNKFQITQVSLGDMVTITFSFPLAQSCNPRFPILNYTLSISSVDGYQLDFNAEQDEDPLVRSLDLPGIERDGVFEVFIETCISIACRQSKTLELRTTDLQAASITFFENNIFVTCTFASDSIASGCAIQLVLVNTTELFVVFQSGTNVSQCNQTMNQRNAYNSISAGDFEDNGDLGTELVLLEPLVLTDADSYTSWTGCDIPQPVPGPTLSTGAIAGIVAGVVLSLLIVGAVVLGLVVVVLVYRVRTGHWFKFKEMDDDQKLTVHFEKELLIGNIKRRSKVSALFCAGKESPDGQQGGFIVLADGGAVESDKTGTEEQDAGTATNPDSAFTLDISSDRKKVKLHLNRALIRRALKEKNLNTMECRRAVRQTSISKQHLLPLHCEVRVQVEEEQN